MRKDGKFSCTIEERRELPRQRREGRRHGELYIGEQGCCYARSMYNTQRRRRQRIPTKARSTGRTLPSPHVPFSPLVLVGHGTKQKQRNTHHTATHTHTRPAVAALCCSHTASAWRESTRKVEKETSTPPAKRHQASPRPPGRDIPSSPADGGSIQTRVAREYPRRDEPRESKQSSVDR